MQVSIIMPCHNGAKYISRSIESVLAQEFTDWELLVTDDGSTDESVEIVKSYCQKDSRIRLLENKHPTGMPSTPRNIGIQNAVGRYIAFLDCDDVWLPSKLKVQMAAFDKYGCGVVYSYYKKMDESGEVHDRPLTSPPKVTYKQLLYGNCIGNLTGVYDTRQVGKVYQKEVHHEDYVMWLDILRKGVTAFNTNTVEAIYREYPNSTSAKKLHVFGWTWDIYRRQCGLSLPSSLSHFIVYAIKGILKKLK